MAALAILPGASAPTLAQLLQRGLQSLLQAAPSSLLELLPPIVLAVPKSKVSHSRKSMRSAHKGLNEKFNIVTCPGCGRAKMAHHLCQYCYSEITRSFKASQRHASTSQHPASSSSTTSMASTPSTSSAAAASASKSPVSASASLLRWAEERGGADAIQPGQKLTKWMRARLGFKREDPVVRLGNEHLVQGSNRYRGSGARATSTSTSTSPADVSQQQRRGKATSAREQQDENEDDGSWPTGGVGGGLQFA